MKRLLFAVSLLLASRCEAGVIYSQPSLDGGLIASSWLESNGSDSDMYVYDSFILASNQAITEVRWRGGYIYGAPYGKAWNFTVTIYDSIAGGSQPLLTNPQLPEIYLAFFDVGDNAGETSAGVIGGTEFFDYHYVLSTPFQAEAGRKYWIRIEASQSGYPDWGIAAGTGPDNSHFRFSTGAAMFAFGQGDSAFTLLATDGPTCTINASASPAAGGSIVGAGVYPIGSNAALTAMPNPGFVFVRWSEGGTTVSQSASYNFTASGDRTLVANFGPAMTIVTASSPPNGGVTTGDGDYIRGSTAIVGATPNPGFVFANWSEFGEPVYPFPTYSFTALTSRTLVANFAQSDITATFDFDTGTPALFTGQGFPITQTASGVTAQFSSPQGNAFSIQTDSSTQFHMSQFAGHYVYPNNQDRNHFVAQFDTQLTDVTVTFATADFHQIEIPTSMLLTAYNTQAGGATVGTATAHGTYAGDTMPMGTIRFTAPGGTSFDKIDLVLPYQANGSTAFLLDNVVVTKVVIPGSPTPSPTPTPSPSPSSTPTASGSGSPTASLTPSLTPTPTLTPTLTPSPLPPVFVIHPASQTVNAGEDVVFTALAEGEAPLAYQWRKMGMNIDGKTTGTLNLRAVTDTDAASYDCVATNPGGSTPSNPATLAVNTIPAPNDATWIGHTLPARMPPGAALLAGLKLGNVSSLSWGDPQGYALKVVSDPDGLFQGAGWIAFGDTTQVIPPGGGVASFVAEITAPAALGVHSAQVRMTQHGVEFGQTGTISVETAPKPNAAENWAEYE